MTSKPIRSLLAVARWAILAAPAVLIGTLQGGATCTGKAPPNPEMLRNQKACVEYIQKSDADRAETRCEICLQYDPKNPECLNGLGLVWFYRGVDDKARDYFKTAINFNNDFAEARNNFGVLKFKNEDFAGARELFASAVEIDPAYIDARYNLALTYLRMGQLERAAEMRKPEKSRDFAMQFAQYVKAEKEYRKIFELDPQHFNSYHDMGVIESYRAEDAKIENDRRTHIGESERFFKRCIELNAVHETCHANLAHLYLGAGRYDESMFHFVQCLASNKNNPVCLEELPEAYKRNTMQSESIKKYIEQIQKNPGYAPAHYGLCQAFFAKGLVDYAVTECENTLKLDPEFCMANYELAEHYRKVLDKEKAIAYCRAFIGCAKAEQATEAETCKETVRTLEVQ